MAKIKTQPLFNPNESMTSGMKHLKALVIELTAEVMGKIDGIELTQANVPSVDGMIFGWMGKTARCVFRFDNDEYVYIETDGDTIGYGSCSRSWSITSSLKDPNISSEFISKEIRKFRYGLYKNGWLRGSVAQPVRAPDS